jgi:hypothetical protein
VASTGPGQTRVTVNDTFVRVNHPGGVRATETRGQVSVFLTDAQLAELREALAHDVC